MTATVRTGPGRRRFWAWARVLGGAAILAVLVWRVGTGPFLAGVRGVNPTALAVAAAIGLVTTVACAWRWRLIAAGLGVRLPFGEAVAAYYRSQFLNTTLPGGVLGDVHRAVRHGRDIGDVGLGVRAVVLDRISGQVVQVGLAAVLLCGLASPVRRYAPIAVGLLAATVVAALVLARIATRTPTRTATRANARGSRLLRRTGTDLRAGLFAHGNWAGVGLSSTVVTLGQLATFLLAARTAGATAAWSTLVPLGLLALLAMAVPLNVAGWGPREGVAAWAFAAAGLTASQGVAAAVTYGVLVFVAGLPGAAVLLARSRHTPAPPAGPDPAPDSTLVSAEASHG